MKNVVENTCPVCELGMLAEHTVTERFTHKGRLLEIEDYRVLECNECEESIVPSDTLKRSERKIRDFHRSVDGFSLERQQNQIVEIE